MTSLDGKVTLNQQRLKILRRKQGISQEQLAFQCAEQGLCVSVASIKRAETKKNILYRTARDIARFYQVSVDELINEPQTSPVKPISKLTMQRHLVILRICWQTNDGSPEDTVVLPTLCKQYHASIVHEAPNDLWLAFGVNGTKGSESLMAIYFAKFYLNELSSNNNTARCAVMGITLGHNQSYADIVNTPPNLLQEIRSQSCAWFSAGDVIIDENLCPEVEREFVIESVNNTSMNLYRLTNKSPHAQPTLPLAGRHIELLQFQAIIDSTVNFSGAHLICLSGIAGIGKSRLLSEFTNIAKIEGMTTYLFHIADFGERHVQQLIPKLANTFANTGLDNMRNDYDTLNKSTQNTVLHALLGKTLNSEQQHQLNNMPHQVHVEHQIRALAELLRTHASNEPLLIAIEDFHWADEITAQIIYGIMQESIELPIVWVLTYRPERIDAVSTKLNHVNIGTTVINLTPLDSISAQKLAKNFSDVDDHHQLVCIKKAQGHPLFLEYLLRDHKYYKEGHLPYSLQTLIASRIESLAPQHKNAIVTASVLGQHFQLDVLRRILNDEKYDPQALCDAYLINRLADAHRFNHALIQDGIYLSINTDDRTQLHQRCAEYYLPKDLPLAVKHLDRARSPDIKQHLISAIQSAAKHFKFDTALELIEIGRRIDYTTLEAFPLLFWHAEILSKLGRIQRSVSVAREAQIAASSAEETLQALLLQANGLNTLDDFTAALSAIDQAEKIATGENLLTDLAKIFHLKGNIYFPRGDSQACLDYQQKALNYAELTGHIELQASTLGGLGDASYAQGKMNSSYNYLRRCMDICQKHQLQHIEAPYLFMMGTVRIYQNEYEQALNDTLRAIDLADRVGHKRAEVVARLTAGWIYLDALLFDEADNHITKALTLAQNIGAQRFIPFLEESRARWHFYQQEHELAQKTIHDALKKVKKLNADTFIGPWLLGTEALVSNDINVAENSLRKGQDMLDDGCIGHNYFRFHVLAIEAGIKFQRQDIIQYHHHALKKFTADEPTPWSAFYLQRAELVLEKFGGRNIDSDRQSALMSTGQEAGLNSALPELEILSTLTESSPVTQAHLKQHK